VGEVAAAPRSKSFWAVGRLAASYSQRVTYPPRSFTDRFTTASQRVSIRLFFASFVVTSRCRASRVRVVEWLLASVSVTLTSPRPSAAST